MILRQFTDHLAIDRLQPRIRLALGKCLGKRVGRFNRITSAGATGAAAKSGTWVESIAVAPEDAGKECIPAAAVMGSTPGT